MPQAGAVWVDVIPSMKGFGRSVQKQATTNLAGVGSTAGTSYGASLTTAATSGAATAGQAVTSEMDAAGKQVAATTTESTSRFGRFGARARTVLSGVGSTAVTAFRATMSGAGTAAVAIGGAADRIGGAVRQKMMGPLSRFGGMLKRYGPLAATALVGGVAVSAVKAGLSIQQATKTLSGLYGSTKLAKQTIEGLNRVASTSPLGYDAFYKGAQSLAYAGVKGKQATGILENMGLAIVSIGGSSENMERANDAVLKMVNAGKVSLDSLQQLSNAGVPIISGLAAHFQVSQERVNAMASAGKIGLQDVLSVMQNATGKSFQQAVKAGKAASQTLSAQFKIARNNIDHALGAALQSTIERLGPVVSRVGRQASTAFKGLPAVLTQVKATMQRTGVTAALQAIGRAALAIARGAWPVLQGAVVGLGVVFGGLAIALRPAAALLTVIGNWMASHAGIVRTVAAAVTVLVAAMVAYNIVAGAVRTIQAGLIAASYGQAGASYVAGTALRVYQLRMVAAKIATIATTVAQNIATAATWAWTAATSALTVAFRALTGPIGWVITAVTLLVAGVIYAWRNFGWFRTAVLATWNGIKIAALAAWTVVLQPVFTALKVAVLAVGRFFVWLWHNAIQPAWAGIRLAINIAWIIIRAVFTAIRWYITQVLAPIFLWLYRNIVKPVWTLIRIAIKVAWVLIQVIFGLIRIGLKILGMAFRWLWTNVVRPVWNGIRRIIAAQWAAIKLVFNAIVRVVRTVLGAVFRWLWHNVISPVWNGIRRVIAVVWNTGIRPVFAAIRRYLIGPMATVFRWIWHTIISPIWHGISRTIASVWTNGIRPVFAALSRFIRTTVPNAFRSGVNAIKTAWNKVKAAAKWPVSFILRTVIKKGIVDNFNKIAKVFKVPQIKFTVPKGFAVGGAVRGPGSGTSDSIPARLSNNEHVWTAREVAGAGGHAAVERMRAAAARGDGMPFARGGRASLIAFGKWLRKKGARVGEGPAPFGPVHRVHASNSWHYRNGAIDVNYGPGGQSGTEQAFFDKIIKSGIARKSYGLRSIWRYPGHYNHAHFDVAPGPDLGMRQSGKRGLLAGLADAVGAITNPFAGLMKKVRATMAKAGQWGGVLTGAMKKLISGAWDWVKAHNPFSGGDTQDGELVKGGGKVRAIVQKTAKQFGWASGAQWRALSWLISHESGWRPTAQNPRSTAYGLFQFLNGTWGSTGIRKTSDPAKQALAGMRYIRSRYNSPLGAKRFWQSHNWYDDGGMLQPGATRAFNASRRPEPVLTDRQWQQVRAYLPTSGAAGRAALVGSVHIDAKPDDAHAMMDELTWRLRTIRRGGVYALRPGGVYAA